MNQFFSCLYRRRGISRVSLCGPAWQVLMGVALAVLLAVPAQAVNVESVYAAEVDLPTGTGGLTAAYNAALEQVLVKVTGLTALGNNAARKSLVPDASRLVRQYSRLPGNRLSVEFDGVALRAVLDAAGQPVWGTDRPLIALWYGVDAGNGQRSILSGDAAGTAADRGDSQDALREYINTAATERGLPIVFPLVDAEDLAAVSFSDVWGNFVAPLSAASARYGAEGLLIGRARSFSENDRRVRWTLATRTEQFAWEGSVADGPRQAAQYLAQRFATYANASGSLHVVITGIDRLERLGKLQQYFRSLSVVQSAAIARVQDDAVEFELQVRGDADRLSRSLDASGIVKRIDPPQTVTRRPDLSYAWANER